MGLLRTFYEEHRAWRGLLVASLILTYGGGAVMFWFHAIYLGEGGPAISPWHHWLLDSTAGFIGLTPVIAIIVPFAAAISSRNDPRTNHLMFAIVAGVLLAFVTAPAPILHDHLIGRGTWLAERVTHLLGHHHVATGEPQELPVPLEMGEQVAAGIPTYVTLMGLSWLAFRTRKAQVEA
jgi:hypothetical protein